MESTDVYFVHGSYPTNKGSRKFLFLYSTVTLLFLFEMLREYRLF